jgi:hypothetical protein
LRRLWGRLLDPRRTSCSDSCYSLWCSGSLSVWIALVAIGFTIKGLFLLVLIGIVLLLGTGVFGAVG